MAWAPVDDTQTPSWGQLLPTVPGGWGLVPATNTPNWGVIRPISDGAFQLGAFQPAYQIGVGVAVWDPVNDAQTVIWVPIPP